MRPLITEWRQARVTAVRRIADRIQSRGLIVGSLIVITAMSAIVVSALAPPGATTTVYRWCATNPLVVQLSLGAYALLLVMRLRASVGAEYAHSWLRATPISASSFTAMIALRVSFSIAAHAAVISVAIVVFALATRDAIALLLMPALSGLAIGSVVGAVWPQPGARQASEASRFVLKAKRTDTPSLAGLSRWPVLAALAWHRPENSRWLFVAAALSVPMGSSALLGLAILAVWSLGSYLFALIRCLPIVAAQAALWLRPTAISFPRFAWALVQRVLMHQCVGTALLCGVLILMDATALQAMHIGALWLSLVAMIGAICTNRAFRAVPSAGRMVASVAAVLVAEAMSRGGGVVLSSLITLAHVRGATHARS